MAEIELTTVLADDKEGYVHARLPEEVNINPSI